MYLVFYIGLIMLSASQLEKGISVLQSMSELNKYGISLVIRQSFFPSKSVKKSLDPSYKMALDLWDSLERVKLVLQPNFIGLI